MAASDTFFSYKGRPLVRSADVLYYGNMYDPYVVMIQVKTKKKLGDEEISDVVSLQMISTNTNVPPDKLILKRAEKEGLYQALDIASVWLDRMPR